MEQDPTEGFEPIDTFENLRDRLAQHHKIDSMSNIGERLACMILSLDRPKLQDAVDKWKDEDWGEDEYGPMQSVMCALDVLSARVELVKIALTRVSALITPSTS